MLGLTAEQVERVYRDIEAKRRATRYLHQRAAPGRVRSRRPSACAASPASSRSRDGRRPARSRTLAAHGGRAAAPRSGRVRRLPRRARRRSATPASRSSTSPPASSRSPTRTARCGSSSTARSSTTSSCAPELVALGHRFRTRSDTEVIVHAYEAWGDGRVRALQRSVRGRALGRAAPGADPRPRSARRAAALPLPSTGGRLCFASEVKAIFAGDPAAPPRPRPGRAWPRPSPSGRVVAAAERLRGRRPSSSPGTSASYAARRRRERAVLARRAIPRGPARATSGGSLEEADRAGARRARARPSGCACSAPTCRWAATSPAGSTARWSRRSGASAKGERFCTFSIRFEDAEYDETEFQRLMAARIGSEHHEVVVARGATSPRPSPRWSPTPSVPSSAPRRRRSSSSRGWCASRASRWCSPARAPTRCSPATTSFARARCAGSGRGHPASALRPRLLERLYPYLARSPVAPARHGRGSSSGASLECAGPPGLRPRARAGAAPRRCSASSSPELRHAAQAWRRRGAPARRRCRPSSRAGRPSPRTSTSRCARCSPATCSRRRATGCSWPTRSRVGSPSSTPTWSNWRTRCPTRYKLRVLDEKHVLKRAAAGLVPEDILAPPQAALPRAGRALLRGRRRPGVDGRRAAPRKPPPPPGCSTPGAVAQLWSKCQASEGREQFSNADNMALVGVLSTALLHRALIRAQPSRTVPPAFQTVVDRTGDRADQAVGKSPATPPGEWRS